MSVDYKNSEYDNNINIWEKCTACYEGEESIKEAGDKYLPRLSGQLKTKVKIVNNDNPNDFVFKENTSDMQGISEYESYKQRAKFRNYIKKVTDGSVEQLFRKNLKLEYPDGLQNLMEHFTVDNKSFLTAVKESNTDLLLNFRSVLLLDMPETGFDEHEIISVKQAEESNIRPYAVYYKASSVINWKYDYIDNKPSLTLVVIQETVEDYTEDEFEPDFIPQLRVLDIEDGQYRIRLYRKDGGVSNEPTLQGAGSFQNTTPKTVKNIEQSDWSLYIEKVPMFYGKHLNFIPCYFITPRGLSFNIEKPWMNDACNINIGHYINSADYENALNITGSPTPVIKGMNIDPDEQVEIGLGSSKAIILNGSDADAFYMEYKGRGPDCIKSAMSDKVDALSVIAGRMLQNDPAGVESAEVAKIHRQAEYGQLASMALSLSEAYTMILKQIADWMGLSGEVIVSFNTDYIDATMDSKLLGSLTSSLMSGSISNKVFYYMLEKGELTPPGWTFEQEQDSIRESKTEDDLLNINTLDKGDDTNNRSDIINTKEEE